MITHRQAQEAGLALLKALGVKDLDQIVSFTLHFHHAEYPSLTIVRDVNEGLGDKTTLAAAAALAPAVQVVEETAAP